ncbi:iron chelate uptake ABC transporter family permease subunit, partial [Aerococcus urinae]
GRDIAVELGVPYQAEMRKALAASALLVACATALVGPLMFFGLLVVNIAVFLVRSDKIKHLIIASSALGIVILVGGQALLEHVL